MITSRQDPADDGAFGRVVTSDGVMPTRDTGFRMTPQPAFHYVPGPRVEQELFQDDFMHNDDVTDVGPATLRGQALDAVRAIRIEREKVISRQLQQLRADIARREKSERAIADRAPDGGSWN